MIDFDVFKFTLIFNLMDVAAYIKELLYREQVVYVPGLGTFSAKKTAGTYNQEQQKFYPPKNSIAFTADEKTDQALENYISEQKNISLQAAKYFIEKFADQLKKDSAAINLPVNEVLFPPGDELSPETQKPDTAFNEENFGLPPVNLTTIKSKNNEEEIVSKHDYVENFYREFSKNLPEEPVETKPKKSTGLWAAAAAVLILCFAGIYALYTYHPDLFSRFRPQEKQLPTIIREPKPDSASKVVVEKLTVKDTVATKPAETTPAADTTAAQSKMVATVPKPVKKIRPEPVITAPPATAAITAADPEIVEKSQYEIIGAAFKTLKGAKTFLNQLKSKGMHSPKILRNTAGKSMLITFGSFPDKESAQAALERIRTKDTHSEAYIQHYNK